MYIKDVFVRSHFKSSDDDLHKKVFLRFLFMKRGDAVSPEHGLHLVGEGRDHVPGDEEGGHVEQVEEDLVPVAQRRTKVAVAGRAAGTELLRSQHSLNHDDVVG
jgi:hypothetical protein